MTKKESATRDTRPPIVTVVGHIDHGKSTLLDYIRHSNVAEGEAGGITQHLSAYEAAHESQSETGEPLLRHITFLDTPGHEAFHAMRARGLDVADVAILIVSAEDGAKPQTVEALRAIEKAGIPYIVAFTKIDKPGADLERAKMSLLEHSVLLEGFGGDIPFVAISSKTGQGIPELLDLILLAADMEGLSADPSQPAQGVVIETNVDNKRGNTATLIVQNGTITSGEYIVCGESVAPVRIMENFLGKTITQALPGSPIRVVGFSTLPPVGAHWRVVESKKEAEVAAASARTKRTAPPLQKSESEDRVRYILPLVIKTDVAGTADAVLHELEKLPKDERMEVRVVSLGVGPINESDVRFAGSAQHPGIVLGFNVKTEREVRDLSERLGVTVAVFDVIYKLAEWLGAEIETRRPRQETEEQTGTAKILKIFSVSRGRAVVGGKIESGALVDGGQVVLMRREAEVGRGEIISLQSQKNAVKKVESGEFGAMLKITTEPAPGDSLSVFEVVTK
jgi:translation initiation factor IF-2